MTDGIPVGKAVADFCACELLFGVAHATPTADVVERGEHREARLFAVQFSLDRRAGDDEREHG